jgi:hypothetical protein
MRSGDVIAQESPGSLLAQTGARDAEQAFLAVVRDRDVVER